MPSSSNLTFAAAAAATRLPQNSVSLIESSAAIFKAWGKLSQAVTGRNISK